MIEANAATSERVSEDAARCTQKYVGAVENAVSILRFLTHHHAPAGVAHIARETGVNVSTTFNILRTLAKEGLIAFNPASKEYSPGLGLLELSVPLLGVNQIDLLHPLLEELSGKHRALIGLWKITPRNRIILVDRVVEGKVVRVDMALGSRLPAFVGAVGRCVAAARTFSKSELHRRFKALRWQNPPSFEAYSADVVRARKIGFAFDRGNLFQGLDIAAAVITDSEGQARFGISGIAVIGQMTEAELQALAHALHDTAVRISANLYGTSGETSGSDAATPISGGKK
jgi:DNA-binding IclR family transcriptional regulator